MLCPIAVLVDPRWVIGNPPVDNRTYASHMLWDCRHGAMRSTAHSTPSAWAMASRCTETHAATGPHDLHATTNSASNTMPCNQSSQIFPPELPPKDVVQRNLRQRRRFSPQVI